MPRDFGDFRPYVSVAERRARAKRELERLAKTGGRTPEPVVLDGDREIARTFWGRAWCDNLARWSDHATRLPRGRSYVREGAVVDLEIVPGEIRARVMGSELYRVTIAITPLDPRRWQAIVRECAGGIASVVDLLRGRFATGVMTILAREDGLFPRSREIRLACSCPDAARLCKHIAATLYGVGARLDEKPELLFTLRQVDQSELVASASRVAELGAAPPPVEKRIDASADLAAIFGIELDLAPVVAVEKPAKKKRRKR